MGIVIGMMCCGASAAAGAVAVWARMIDAREDVDVCRQQSRDDAAKLRRMVAALRAAQDRESYNAKALAAMRQALFATEVATEAILRSRDLAPPATPAPRKAPAKGKQLRLPAKS